MKVENTTSNSQGSIPVPVYTSDQGIQIKRVAEIVLIVFGALMTAVCVGSLAVLAVCLALGTMPVLITPMIILASTTGGIALAILAIKAWQKGSPYLPQSIRQVANWVESAVTETFGLIALGSLFFFNDSKLRNPKERSECDSTQTPILMIHGFFGGSNNWVYHRHLLEANGHKNVFSINLGSPFKTIEEYGTAVKEKVARIQEVTGRDDLILIGHSMGGIVGKEYIYTHAEEQGVNVIGEISLGTPHDGTRMAPLLSWLLPPAKAMEYRSPYVQGLQVKANADEKVNYFHIATKTDLIIIPDVSAVSSFAKKQSVAWLETTGHVGYLFSFTTGQLLLNKIKEWKDLSN